MPPDLQLSSPEEPSETLICSPPRSLKGDEDASALQQAMLDAFPVTQEELDMLWQCHSYMEGSSSYTLATLAATSTNVTSNDPHYVPRRQVIEQVFLTPLESRALLEQAQQDVFLIGTGHDDSEVFMFVEAIMSLLGRRGARSLLQTLYRVVRKVHGQPSDCHTDEPTCNPSAEDLTFFVYRLFLATQFLKEGRPENARPVPPGWVRSLQERGDAHGVSEAVWLDWVQAIVPQVYQVLSTFVHYVIFSPSHPFCPTQHPLRLPQPNQECALWEHACQAVPASLSLLSPNFAGPWKRQFSTDFDGLSFATFQQALLGYQGPTVILLQTTKGDAFGFYTNCSWKESKHWYGAEADSFLFGLKPSLQYYSPVGDKQFHMYLYNPLSPCPGDLHGLAIGGIGEKTPRIQITTSLEQCKAGSMDGVFTSGPLLSDGEVFFDIDVLEIWAVNVSADEYAGSLAAGAAQAQIREGHRIKTAQVDRAQFLEDFQSGEYMNSLYAHRGQIRGRHSFCADDDEKRGYFVADHPPTPNCGERKVLDRPEEAKDGA